MAEDKPLHVRVAEALGWTQIQYARNFLGVYVGRPPGELQVGYESPPVPRYDTNWAATGPLIERLTIALGWAGDNVPGQQRWAAMPGGFYGHGETTLLAVCALILALSEAGKLPRG